MKTKNLFATALFAVGVCVNLASCSNDAVEAVSEDSVVRLTSNIAAITRGTDLNRQATQIVAGQKIGVTITGAKDEHNKVVWTSEANGTLSCDQTVYFDGDNTIDIEAYHPYLTSDKFDADGKFDLSVSTDQSTDEGYLNSDWLYSKKLNVTKKQSPVTLGFSHQMAKINVTVKTSNEDFEEGVLNGAEVWICGVKNAARVTLEEFGGASTSIFTDYFTSEETVDIKAAELSESAKTEDGAYTATVIIIPQQVPAGRFIKVVIGDNNYYYKLANPKTFFWRSVFTFNLTLKKTRLDIDNENIDPWLEKDTTDGEAEEG